ncbi:transporter substrate-binding domain-containing protein [Yimella sp. cx-51]|nr:transporter substrate-binding domain-containing protein [Yimella sp. cx-51]
MIGGLSSTGLLLTGCGTEEGGGKDGYKLVSEGKLTFAMSGQYRPFNFYESAGKLAGFDVEIGNALAKWLDLTPNPVTGPFDSLVAGLAAKRYDLIIGSMSATEARKKAVDFTDNYYESGAQLFVKKGSPIKSAADLKNATVGVTLGTTFEELAKKQSGVKDVKTYNSDNQALVELGNGRVDAVITTKLVGLYQIKQTKLAVEAVGPVLAPDPAAIASRKDNSDLTKKVNEFLKKIKSDGEYAKISQKWFGEDISKS